MHPSPEGIDVTLLDRYLAGECTPDEIDAVRRALESDPRALSPEVALRVMRRDAAGMPLVDTDARWKAFRDRVIAQTAEQPISLRGGTAASRHWGLRGWGISGAAALATIVVIVATLLNRTSNGGERIAAPRSGTQYTTRMGQRAIVTLADGSRVTLAPQTTLRLDPGFNTGSRVMTLSGEAYFEVTNATGAPFIVQTGNVVTRVLGTTFTVRRYSTDRDVHVAVVSGKVHVAAATSRNPSITLVSGAVGVVTDSSAKNVTTGGTAPYLAWTEGQLVFHKAPAAEVLAALTRWYGYQFRLTDPALERENLTIGISTQSSSEALATLKRTLDVDLSFDGTIITLSPRRTTQNAAPKTRGWLDTTSPRSREIGR